MTDGDEYAAEVVGIDGDKDIAVLKLKMPEDVVRKDKLHPVTLGTSSDLLVGQRVYAIGAPHILCLPYNHLVKGFTDPMRGQSNEIYRFCIGLMKWA